ncbi:hypothetical protein DPMN_033162 [Dreissena polymorpha]|uniref:Uncharacterized protein n=1 Tax=Dreissena polymorpha TaxID=45954 RepID=A0A9D4RIX8_DREPO|nr:hypothetical protein DPMN_033162 [Dreissena polymorpha]
MWSNLQRLLCSKVYCALCPLEASRSRSRTVGWRLRGTIEPEPDEWEADGATCP